MYIYSLMPGVDKCEFRMKEHLKIAKNHIYITLKS